MPSSLVSDRGFLFPELTEAATRPEADNLRGLAYEDYVSSNLTCEVGMTRATGRGCWSIINLLEEATREPPLKVFLNRGGGARSHSRREGTRAGH